MGPAQEIKFARAILAGSAEMDCLNNQQYCQFCSRGIDEGDQGVMHDVPRADVYKFIDHDDDCIVNDAICTLEGVTK